MIDYKGKRVAVIGAGISGLDACLYGIEKGANVTVLDQKSEDKLEDFVGRIKELNINRIFGPDYLKDLAKFDIIVRSPGVKLNTPEIQAAQARGTIITSPTIEFFQHCPCLIIGVTGTKGKGTTSSLIYEILKASGSDVYLAGNIGAPMLELLSRLTRNSKVVLELSSFQLQDLNKSPHIGVITNVTVDHLDYHKTRDEYVKAKENIIKFQDSSDYAVLNLSDPTSSKFFSLTEGVSYFYQIEPHDKEGCYIENGNFVLSNQGKKENIVAVNQLAILGKHNWFNAAAAILASHLTGAEPEAIKRGIQAFKGLEHRLEYVATINGVRYYNDSFGTTPETAIVAIEAFEEPIILIAGGSEKGSDFTNLGKKISQSSVKALILIGDMAGRIEESVVKAGGIKGQIVKGLKSMHEIVAKSDSLASPKDVVLLSPACASFDMFKNYKERGMLFKQEVKRLQE
jgi:UDP-N-acetylmuramoylalanine--D-glutamate ligase